jgi:hypothetical protein
MKDTHLKTVAAAKKLIEIRNDTILEKVWAIGCRRKFEHDTGLLQGESERVLLRLLIVFQN